MQYRLPILLFLATAIGTANLAYLTGKFGTKAKQPTYPHYDGVCAHPAVNGGAPFNLTDAATFDGVNIRANLPDGTESILTGATCALERKVKQ